MITKPTIRLLRVSIARRNGALTTSLPATVRTSRHFSSTKENKAKNRIYTPVRRPDDFSTNLLLSTSSRTPMLTLWTASYCNTCRTVAPIIRDLIEAGVGEEEGGVSFCEVEYDAPDIMEGGLGMEFMITSMPTLLSFDRGEAQTQTKVVDARKMGDREWMREWIKMEARRQGGGGGGGGGLFGGLFGNMR
ncbi:hypothetical protein LOCC1_G004238 [Lachnellula occidentalis]|uniref:Thioredoxin domain-containing protein n=1 Tax=Lachnellula occidentalis TaxID=215460 RepID=A0A8H8RSH1_9HELO|nr:hypothetical protein LOCC1_G004238 [Lachnellula occidentalis]